MTDTHIAWSMVGAGFLAFNKYAMIRRGLVRLQGKNVRNFSMIKLFRMEPEVHVAFFILLKSEIHLQ